MLRRFRVPTARKTRPAGWLRNLGHVRKAGIDVSVQM